nr:hypothetical protein [Tanacetum cinerariifolium]
MVLKLKKTKTSQYDEIASLKRRVKKLEKRNRSRPHKLKRLYKLSLTASVESSDDEESLGEDASKHEMIKAIDAYEDITSVNDQDDADNEMFYVNDLGGEENIVGARKRKESERRADTRKYKEVKGGRCQRNSRDPQRRKEYQIVRADGKSQMYMFFSQRLKSFGKEDLEDLYKLVKARYESTRPIENMDYLLWSDMDLIFEPHVKDEVSKRQQGYKVLE